MRSWNQASESTQLRVTRVFFLSLLSRNFDDQLTSNFHKLFHTYVEIHQVKRLVFGNYQQFPVSLSQIKIQACPSQPVLTSRLHKSLNNSSRTMDSVLLESLLSKWVIFVLNHNTSTSFELSSLCLKWPSNGLVMVAAPLGKRCRYFLFKLETLWAPSTLKLHFQSNLPEARASDITIQGTWIMPDDTYF